MEFLLKMEYESELDKAENLLETVVSFGKSGSENPQKITRPLAEVLEEIRKLNVRIDPIKESYVKAVELRITKFLNKSENSINKVVVKINVQVKALFGKDSREAVSVEMIIVEMRSNRRRKPGATTDETLMRNAFHAYQVQTRLFSDLVAKLIQLRSQYKPSHPAIKISQLIALHNDAVAANNAVRDAYLVAKHNYFERLDKYRQLQDIVAQLIDDVRKQYGLCSLQFVKVKQYRF
ncbi:hypothetical protein [Flavobacterium kingsejongi]|uniref:Uncharacterized protein n=1 Tax=Flavobacterium kingsejongi TaxID=1678728 RepID=A0A2S1LTJ5_9FLAO|nr:hypothetical protein [Flavobacterium kingsejongi]AWG27085.1 hypothetical protein FK004_18600 [Flavobacterium kingsejongi]